MLGLDLKESLDYSKSRFNIIKPIGLNTLRISPEMMQDLSSYRSHGHWVNRAKELAEAMRGF